MRKLIVAALTLVAIPVVASQLMGCSTEAGPPDEPAATETKAAVYVPDSCRNRELACTRCGLEAGIGGLNTWAEWAAEHASEMSAGAKCAAGLLLKMNELPAVALECVEYVGGEKEVDPACLVRVGLITTACTVASCFPQGAPIAIACTVGKIAAACYECSALGPICEQDKQNALPIDPNACPYKPSVMACTRDGNGNLAPRNPADIDRECRAVVDGYGYRREGSNSATWYNCQSSCFKRTIDSAKENCPAAVPGAPPAPPPVVPVQVAVPMAIAVE